MVENYLKCFYFFIEVPWQVDDEDLVNNWHPYVTTLTVKVIV